MTPPCRHSRSVPFHAPCSESACVAGSHAHRIARVQDVIEELDVSERLKKTLALTKRELSLSNLTQKIKEYVCADSTCRQVQ
jgi:ATP-dependent Lon protease